MSQGMLFPGSKSQYFDGSRNEAELQKQIQELKTQIKYKDGQIAGLEERIFTESMKQQLQC